MFKWYSCAQLGVEHHEDTNTVSSTSNQPPNNSQSLLNSWQINGVVVRVF